MPWLKSLIPNLRSGATHSIRDFDLRLGGCEICASEIYFSIFLENRLKWPSAWILRFNLRLGGYSIWSASTSRTIYDQRFQGLSSSQPRSKQNYLEDYSTYLKEGPEATRRMFWLLEVLNDAQPSTRRLQNSATKSSGACQTRNSGTAYRHRMF